MRGARPADADTVGPPAVTVNGSDLVSAQRPVLLAVVLLAVLVGSAAAQSVVGRVVEAGTGRAVAGALVTLLEAGEVGVATGLTGPDGAFTLQAPEPGSYRIRAEAIGYRIIRSPLLTVEAGEPTRHVLALPVRPLALDELTVAGDRRACATPREQGAALQTVWEEARKALNAVSWAQREAPLVYDVEVYRRELSPVSLEPRSRTADTVFSAPAGRPFVTLSPEELEEDGYIQRGPMGSGPYRYYAPDAEVVLSDGFVETHCFHVERSDARPDWVGLGFRPPGSRQESDIDGVLWVERETAELQRLEFRYTRLPFDIDGRNLGGRLAFTRVATGEWIIAEWWIRAPRLTRRTRRLAGIEERGARILQVRTADGATVFVAGGRGPSDPGPD